MGLKLNPANGDYISENGKPVQDDTLLTSAYIRLKTQRGRWMYAPDGEYGSEFYQSHRRVRTVVEIEEMGRKALQPMIDDKRAQSVTVEADDVARGGVSLSTKIVDDRGRPQILKFNPIGVG
jgi:phage gp46-like protein